MKQLLFFLSFACSINFGYTQKRNKATQLQISIHKSIVKNALKYNDANTAIHSMHLIIALEGKQSTYKDSLAFIYFKSGRYQSSHLLTKELLQYKPADTKLLELNAFSLQHLGLFKKAIESFEALFTKTLNMTHGYQLAQLQYKMKRYDEAKITINQALLCKIPEENVLLQFPVDNQNNQNVPLKAAIYNLQGLVDFEIGDKKSAISAFKEALKISPEFTMATQNYNALIVGTSKKTSLQKKKVNK